MGAALRDLLVEAAKIAGEVHKRVLRKTVKVKPKFGDGSSSDAVTIADTESERFLRAFFAENLPDYNVFGEEFGASYDGNGKVIVIDPLDCTSGYAKGLPVFGPIIGVYDDGRCVGGVEYNVLKNIVCVGTLDSGFEWIGPDDGAEKNVINIESRIPDCPDFSERIRELVRKKFPNNPVVVQIQTPDLLCRTRACTGKWAAYFHCGEALHDFSATPLFGRLNGVLVTDHTGRHYLSFDFSEELRRYQTRDRKQIYSHPLLVARPEYAQGMLEVLSQFKEGLDKRQNANH